MHASVAAAKPAQRSYPRAGAAAAGPAAAELLVSQARVGETGGSQRTLRRARLGLPPSAGSAARPGPALAADPQQAWLELGMAAAGEALAVAGEELAAGGQ